jgi:hypothetical protein
MVSLVIVSDEQNHLPLTMERGNGNLERKECVGIKIDIK